MTVSGGKKEEGEGEMERGERQTEFMCILLFMRTTGLITNKVEPQIL